MVGPALILTSTALVLGFGVLSLSGFAVSSLMGILSAITIAVALVADLLFLPPLIQTFGERRS
jgi:predicted RND superfamily exporter protein